MIRNFEELDGEEESGDEAPDSSSAISHLTPNFLGALPNIKPMINPPFIKKVKSNVREI